MPNIHQFIRYEFKYSFSETTETGAVPGWN